MTHIWKDSWSNYRSLNKFWRLNITVFYFRLEEDLVLQKFRTEYLFLSYRPQFYSSFQIKIGLLNTNYYLYLGLYLSYFQTFSWQLRGFQKWLFSTFPILSLVADRWYRSWYSEHMHVYVRDFKPLTFWNNAVHHNATIFI